MSISTYSELLTACDNWMDNSLSARTPEFIALAEAYFNRCLRTRQMETSSTFTTVSGVATLPTDMASIREVKYLGSPVRTLKPMGDEEFDTSFANSSSGTTPQGYMLLGTQIIIGPANDASSYKMYYYQRIPALTVSNTTNWLLTAFPDVYLAGVLAEAELYDKSGVNGQGWMSRRDSACQDIQMSEGFRNRAPGMQTFIRGSTP